MKKILAVASMILFVSVSILGFAFAEEQAAANESINASLTNGTTNETLNNETLENTTASDNDANPFADAKNRKPSVR